MELTNGLKFCKISDPEVLGVFQSGQMDQTVTLMVNSYTGSNPVAPIA